LEIPPDDNCNFRPPIRVQTPRIDSTDGLLILPDDDYVRQLSDSDSDDGCDHPLHPQTTPRGRLLSHQNFELPSNRGDLFPQAQPSDHVVLNLQLRQALENLRMADREWKSKIQKDRTEATAKMKALLAAHERELREFDMDAGLPRRYQSSPRVLEIVCSPNPSVFKGKCANQAHFFKDDFIPPETGKRRKKLLERQTAQIFALNSEGEASLSNLQGRRNADIALKKEAVAALRGRLGMPEGDGEEWLDLEPMEMPAKSAASASPGTPRGRVVRMPAAMFTSK
jgi:hypothetical protein